MATPHDPNAAGSTGGAEQLYRWWLGSMPKLFSSFGSAAAPAAVAAAPGSTLRLALRPEQFELDITPDAPDDSRRQRLDGEVRDVVFLGDQSRLLVAFDGIGDVVVRLSTRFGAQALHPGDRCRFSYWIDLARLYPAPAAG